VCKDGTWFGIKDILLLNAKVLHILPKTNWTFEFESPELEVGHPFNKVWQIFNEGHLNPGTKKMKENYGINWKLVEMNLSQDTDVNLVTTMRLLWLSMPFLVSQLMWLSLRLHCLSRLKLPRPLK
jgi:hypothetical protein